MSLPVAALSDEELIHYAGIDEEAQAEMARRSVSFRGSYLSEIEDLRREVADLESQLSEAEDDSSSADDMKDCIQRVFDTLKGHAGMSINEAFDAIKEVLDEISDFTR